MAEDFHAAFSLEGQNPKRLSVTDVNGITLAAIQGLDQKLEEKEATIQALELQNNVLLQRLAALEEMVARLADGSE